MLKKQTIIDAINAETELKDAMPNELFLGIIDLCNKKDKSGVEDVFRIVVQETKKSIIQRIEKLPHDSQDSEN